MPGCVAVYSIAAGLDFWPRYRTVTCPDREPWISYGSRQVICVSLTKVSGAANPPGWKMTCTPPSVAGRLVHGLGQVVLFSDTAVAGPMGLDAPAKMAIISPAETGPATKLAALAIPAMMGAGAVTV